MGIQSIRIHEQQRLMQRTQASTDVVVTYDACWLLHDKHAVILMRPPGVVYLGSGAPIGSVDLIKKQGSSGGQLVQSVQLAA